MANVIKGLTIEIGGDTTNLVKSMSEVNKHSKDLSKELKDVDRLLKLDPGNTELVAQKQKLLAESVSTTKEKLDQLREAEKQVQEQVKKGEASEEQYRALQREIIKTEEELKKVEKAAKDFGGSLTQTLKNAGKEMQEFGGKVEGVGKSMTTNVTLPIVAAGGVAFKFAADLQDAMGASDQIFKGSADEVKKWADTLNSSYGIAESEALTYANTMGAMLQNIGQLSEEEAAKQSAMLVELAGDLTAMFGGTTESAVQALTGALKGNTSMLDNYGMGVNEATIKSKALEMGLIAEGEQLDLAGKQAATLALILEQTADAQGQAAREAEGASGTMRALGTELKNIAAELGEVLIPLLLPFIQHLKEIIGKFKGLSPEVQEAIVKVALIAAALGPLFIIIGKVIAVVGTITSALPVLGAAFTVLTGPIGLAIGAIALIVAAGVALYKNWDEVKAAAQKLWENIKQRFNEIKEAITKPIGEAINTLKNINLIEIGKNIISGLISGISSMINKVKEAVDNVVSTVTGGIKRALKIESPSKVMEEMGEYTAEGFAVGIKGSLKEVERQTSAMARIPAEASAPTTAASNSVVTHTGVLRVEGVNNKGDLTAVVDIVMDQLRREVRA